MMRTLQALSAASDNWQVNLPRTDRLATTQHRLKPNGETYLTSRRKKTSNLAPSMVGLKFPLVNLTTLPLVRGFSSKKKAQL